MRKLVELRQLLENAVAANANAPAAGPPAPPPPERAKPPAPKVRQHRALRPRRRG